MESWLFKWHGRIASQHSNDITINDITILSWHHNYVMTLQVHSRIIIAVLHFIYCLPFPYKTQPSCMFKPKYKFLYVTAQIVPLSHWMFMVCGRNWIWFDLNMAHHTIRWYESVSSQHTADPAADPEESFIKFPHHRGIADIMWILWKG